MNLLPCPFCGSSEILYLGDKIKCFSCPASINTKEQWNTRHYPWISVKDRLPEDKEFCLVAYNKSNYEDDSGIGINRYCKKESWLFKETYAYESGITHWMPLPSLSEEK